MHHSKGPYYSCPLCCEVIDALLAALAGEVEGDPTEREPTCARARALAEAREAMFLVAQRFACAARDCDDAASTDRDARSSTLRSAQVR